MSQAAPYLLIGLLAFAAGWVACAVFGVIADDHGRGQVDFTAAAARGDLLHLDWSDQRDDNQRAAG